MAAAFAVMCGIAIIWSGVKSQIVYHSIIDSFPPQFQDPETSRYAFSVLALSPSTPLPLQAEYVKSLWGGCAACLCLSLCFFSLDQPIVGGGCLVVLLASVFFTIKSWNVYKANCNRPAAQPDEDEA